VKKRKGSDAARKKRNKGGEKKRGGRSPLEKKESVPVNKDRKKGLKNGKEDRGEKKGKRIPPREKGGVSAQKKVGGLGDRKKKRRKEGNISTSCQKRGFFLLRERGPGRKGQNKKG